MTPHPPKWADRFLEWYCHPDLIEDLQGDLYEIFIQKHQQGNDQKAQWLYWWLVLRSFRISAIKQDQEFKNSFFAMTKNNLKIAVRVLWRDKFNSAINLLGLTLGITCFLLLGLYVKQELSYDHMHSKKDRIYRSWIKEDYGEGRFFFNSTTPLRFETLFEDNFPEMERVVQYIERSFLVGRGENRITETVAVISPDFFKVFDFEIIEGDQNNPLPSKSNLVISEAYAKKYFGELSPLGQTLGIVTDSLIRDYTITAVMADIPKESSIQFDLALSMENGRNFFGERAYNAWFNVIAETYVLVKESNSINTVEEKMQDVVLSQMGDQGYGDEPMKRDQYNIGFQPILDIHLNPDIPLGFAPVSNPQYVLILAIIGTLVLIVACMNYTTISAGQSLKRSKEVGIRKVLGAPKGALIYQYLSESMLLAILAMSIGTVLTIILIPTFNTLTGTEIFFVFEWWHVGVYFLIGLAIGLVAGAYPALVISAFQIVRILKGGNQSTGKLAVRKGLVVIQFLVTVFLISTVMIMQQQLNFLVNKDLGYEYQAVIGAQMPVDPAARGISGRIESGMQNGQLLQSQLEKHPQISKIAMASHLFGSNGWANLAFTDHNDDFIWFRMLVANPEYFEAFSLEFVEGRPFEKGNGLDLRQSVILNEAAVKKFNLKNPIGSKLPGPEFEEHQIIGVVKDFNYSSLHTEIEPLVIVQNLIPIVRGVSDGDIVDSPNPKIVFTYSGSNLQDGLDILRKSWETVFPNEAMNYQFMDDRIKSQYESEARMNKLITIATVLSLTIAGLGLFGLIMLVANSKVKEIGIRKVMGASSIQIFKLLVAGFLIPMLIAIVLSVPLTVSLMNEWLNNFAYRVNINPIPFILSGILTLIIAGLVIGYHALRASKVNPVDSLRVE